MLPAYIHTVSCLLAAYLIASFARKFSKDVYHRSPPYPPGPRPRIFLGNMFDFPKSKVPQTYLAWGKKYQMEGPILHASSFGKHFVILNRFSDAEELLERRAKIYSDRTQLPIFKLMGWASLTGLLPYGNEWRMHRKLYQKHFRSEAIPDYHPLLLAKVRDLLRGLLITPERFGDHSMMFAASIPMETMYGYNVKSLEDPLVQAAHTSINLATTLLLQGSTLINIFPILAYLPTWFPGAGSLKMAKTVQDLTSTSEHSLFHFAKERTDQGHHARSFVARSLSQNKGSDAAIEDEAAVRDTASAAFSAASDTTNSLLGTFFYLMAKHPEVQERAQKELDAVVGTSRLPHFDDRPSLPYIEAIFREVFRFQPPAPIGMSHAVMEDDVYKGYFIPKGSDVISNIWAMAHDEDVYPNPMDFKPERFFDEAGNLNDDERVLAFGFGRRVCAGRYLASSIMWITMASVLACFKLEESKDEFGNEIEINDDFDESGLMIHKAPFKCAFVPRSPAVIQLMNE
ncbi:hypothetical protein CVT26_001123 [Gymnopilus dilepis]|uniref:Cytochrome P450 n=1 Tax=Gymnopilus dilepis TaxID=231916 RepID=A0A409Y215_9AGAR|nr:hypothetical protein CVT26_001123 [Gymnopilus dilepis]